jgi:hypothetical protein
MNLRGALISDKKINGISENMKGPKKRLIHGCHANTEPNKKNIDMG